MNDLVNKIKHFWDVVWNSIKDGYNIALKEPVKDKVQDYREIDRTNFLNIFVTQLNDIVNNEATFDIVGESTLIQPLEELIQNLEEKRFEITAEMLGTGDCWVFPAVDNFGNVTHRFVPQSDVRIIAQNGEKITELSAIIDKYVTNEREVFFLIRHHTLKDNVLKIETYITNEHNERTTLKQWKEYCGAYEAVGATHIGVGRFKSPVSSRGRSPIYGVPLNYGCREIEDRIFDDIDDINQEFKNGKSILFADSMILRKKKDIVRKDGKVYTRDGYEIPENLFPVDRREGSNGSKIDIFSPDYRYAELRERLLDDMHLYEQQIGVDRGFLTPYESANETTATAIRRLNSNTLALVGRIQNSILKGVLDVIKADCIYLNIPNDLYSVKIDWYDVFADQDIQYQRISQAAKDGYAEPTDVMKWLFPNLTIEELQAKYDRINGNEQNTDVNNTESEQNSDVFVSNDEIDTAESKNGGSEDENKFLNTLKITNEAARGYDTDDKTDVLDTEKETSDEKETEKDENSLENVVNQSENEETEQENVDIEDENEQENDISDDLDEEEDKKKKKKLK